MIQDRSVRSYFKLRKIADSLAAWYWENDKDAWGEVKHGEIRKEEILSTATGLDEKADKLFGVDVARVYYYAEQDKGRRRKARNRRARKKFPTRKVDNAKGVNAASGG